MVKPLLDQLRAKVETASGLPAKTKTELLKLVSELENQTSASNPANAASDPHGVERLVAAVEGLEASHPDITNIVTRLAAMLGNLGI
ncbi:MAG TPA: DUF4404 family protein [Verrucomicrobiae bacterium]|nr:DUF4404 family protein [Verrucomicrobiae bacterium]